MTQRGDVKFVLDAETAKAVNGFLRVVDAQKKGERQFGRSTQQLRRQDRMMQGMAKTAGRMAAGFAGIAGTQRLFSGLTQSVSRLRAETAGFNEQLRPLLSLGDNLSNLQRIREDVLGVSGAFGVDTQEVADAMFNLQSGTANLPGGIQKELQDSALGLTRVAGGALDQNLTAMIKSYQIFGGETMKVADAQRKLFFVAQEGFVTMDDLAKLLPDILPAAKEMGFTFDDVASSIITATQAGGRNEKTFTGLRNVFLRLSQAEREGIELTGTFLDQLDQLNRNADGQALKQIFGDEAMAVAAQLARNSDQVRGNLESISDLPDDLLEQKLGQRMADVTIAISESLKGLDQQLRNFGKDSGFLEQHGGRMEEFALRELGAQEVMLGPSKIRGAEKFMRDLEETPLIGFLATPNRAPFEGMGDISESLFSMGADSQLMRRGLAVATSPSDAVLERGVHARAQILRSQGLEDEAFQMMARQGMVETPGGRELGGSEARLFGEMRASGDVSSPNEFMALIRMVEEQTEISRQILLEAREQRQHAADTARNTDRLNRSRPPVSAGN